MSGVSFTADIPSSHVRGEMEKMVASGDIDIGVNVVEKLIKKNVLTKSGEVVERITMVSGRKHPLDKLRVKLFKRTKKYMRLTSDSDFEKLSHDELVQKLMFIGEFDGTQSDHDMRGKLKLYERTRRLMMWHDGSSIANQGPELYIIGRCGSNDEQLAYIKTRVEDLHGLRDGINLKEIDPSCPDITLNDKMRFFHGDGPAAQLESGNQKGGYSTSCDVHLHQTRNIAHCYQRKPQSLAEKQQIVLRGKFGKLNSIKKVTHPFEKLDKKALESELLSRGKKN